MKLAFTVYTIETGIYLLIFPLLVLIVQNEITVQFSLGQTTFKPGLNYESIKLNLGSIWLLLFSAWNTDIYLMSLYLSDITHELLKVCFTSFNSNQLVLYSKKKEKKKPNKKKWLRGTGRKIYSLNLISETRDHTSYFSNCYHSWNGSLNYEQK